VEIAMRKAITLLLLLAFAGLGEAQTLKPAVDRYGNALPDGAMARLGTVRFRHAQTERVAFAAAGKIVASMGSTGLCLWDAKTGLLLKRLSMPEYLFPQNLTVSPDGQKLVFGLSLIDVLA
jgi:hypothetical protein